MSDCIISELMMHTYCYKKYNRNECEYWKSLKLKCDYYRKKKN